MLNPRLNRIQQRLDLLREGRLPSGSLFDRAVALITRMPSEIELEVLVALDRDLDRVGVHTSADAKLLHRVGRHQGRAGALAQGLGQRASEALVEYERCLLRVERLSRASAVLPGSLTRLERGLVQLARVVKVADLFEGADQAQSAPFEVFERARPRSGSAPTTARMAIAELWTERARQNVGDLVQKRRDLNAAHELLLGMGMGMGGEPDRDRTRQLRIEVSQARERAGQEPAFRSLDELVRQLRGAARSEPQRAYRLLRGLYQRAVEAGDGELAGVASEGIGALLPSTSEVGSLIDRGESDDLLAWGGRARDEQPRAGAGLAGAENESPRRTGERLAGLALDLDEGRTPVFELALGCARYFDVEDALGEEVLELDTGVSRPVHRRVPYPTQTMTYETTSSLSELGNFVISHPGRLIYDLASNRQLIRAYREEQAPRRPKTVRKSAVRVYVCDASGSMHGPRARFRDAIVIAELNNLRAKVAQGITFDPIYLSFFNDRPTELVRIDSGAEATRQIERLFRHSPSEGQTDIRLALVAAFEAIRSAQGRDPQLARATVVLVTDGEDGVELESIRRTRSRVDGLEIALSFISLGEENQDLRSLVLEQRAKGSRAFYHHLSDLELASVRTEFDSEWRTLLPREMKLTKAVVEALTPHLAALEAVARGRAPLLPLSGGSFGAMFPKASAGSTGSGRPSEAELVRLVEVLEAVGEAVSLAPAELRLAESVELLNHLLRVFAIPVPQYLSAISFGDRRIRAAIDRLWLLCEHEGQGQALADTPTFLPAGIG